MKIGKVLVMLLFAVGLGCAPFVVSADDSKEEEGSHSSHHVTPDGNPHHKDMKQEVKTKQQKAESDKSAVPAPQQGNAAAPEDEEAEGEGSH